jgi:hypothetical protein
LAALGGGVSSEEAGKAMAAEPLGAGRSSLGVTVLGATGSACAATAARTKTEAAATLSPPLARRPSDGADPPSFRSRYRMSPVTRIALKQRGNLNDGNFANRKKPDRRRPYPGFSRNPAYPQALATGRRFASDTQIARARDKFVTDCAASVWT